MHVYEVLHLINVVFIKCLGYVWNSLPSYLHCIGNTATFKRYLQTHLFAFAFYSVGQKRTMFKSLRLPCMMSYEGVQYIVTFSSLSEVRLVF